MPRLYFIKSLKLEQQGSVDEFQRTECRRCVESGKEKANSKLSHLAKLECVAFQNAVLGGSPQMITILHGWVEVDSIHWIHCYGDPTGFPLNNGEEKRFWEKS